MAWAPKQAEVKSWILGTRDAGIGSPHPEFLIMNEKLTHFDQAGEAWMVDVGSKDETARRAVAAGTIRMRAQTLAIVRAGTAKKGDVLGVARIAAIQAAKRTWELIPLCHPVALTALEVHFDIDEGGSLISCRATAECRGRTGVEMEALAAVSAGLLTIYDMCKAVDRGMVLGDIRLLEKEGGKSGRFVAP